MKSIFTFLTGLVISTSSYGQDTIYAIAYSPSAFQNFYLEDRDPNGYFFIDPLQSNNIWQIGAPSKATFDSAYSASLALITDSVNTYPINNTSSFMFTVYTDDFTEIEFWHKINSDSLADGGVIEVSTDGGFSWTNIINLPQITCTNFYSSSDFISSNSNKSGFTGTSDWMHSKIQGAYLFDVTFRFTFTSDSINTNKDGWMIDNFSVKVYGTGINQSKVSKFNIYPNPSTKLINISGLNNHDYSCSIINHFGQKIQSQQINNSNSQIDISTLRNGTYFIEIIHQQTNKKSILKFVKIE